MLFPVPPTLADACDLAVGMNELLPLLSFALDIFSEVAAFVDEKVLALILEDV